MYAGRDFDDADPVEAERYSLDFAKDLQTGDEIISADWVCKVAERSEGTDADAATRIVSGSITYAGTKTTCKVSDLVPGVVYVLEAIVETEQGDTVSLWSHVECKEPA